MKTIDLFRKRFTKFSILNHFLNLTLIQCNAFVYINSNVYINISKYEVIFALYIYAHTLIFLLQITRLKAAD